MHKNNKLKRNLLRTGLMLIMLVLFYFVANVALNYIVLAVTELLQALKFQADVTGFGFKVKYLVQPPDNIPIFISFMVAALGVILSGRRVAAMITNRVFKNENIEGSSEWASNKDIKKISHIVPKSEFKKLIPNENANLIIATTQRNYYMDKKSSHTLAVGGTQVGKTQLIVLNTILAKALAGEHQIINDMKGELLRFLYWPLKKIGINIEVINLRDPKLSSGLDPLQYIKNLYLRSQQSSDPFDKADFLSKTIEEIEEYAMILTENKHTDPIWPSSAKSLLTAIIIYMLEDGYKKKCLDKLNMYSVLNFFIEFGGTNIPIGMKTENALDILMNGLPVGHPAKLSYATSKFSVGEMRSSIFSTLSDNLMIFKDFGVANVTSRNDIDFEKILEEDKPTAIFVVVPDEKQNRHKIVATMIHQFHVQAVEYSYKMPDLKLKRPVSFVLDEIGQFVIPNLTNKVTVGLGRNIIYYLMVQDMAQLEEKYGDTNARTIRTNCSNIIYLHSTDEKTTAYLEWRLGKGTEYYDDFSKDSGAILDRNTTTRSKGRYLLDKAELTRLDEGKVILLIKRANPIFTDLTYFYKNNYPKTDIHTLSFASEQISDLKHFLYPFNVDQDLAALQLDGSKQEKAVIPQVPEKQMENIEIQEISDLELQKLLNRCNLQTRGELDKAIKNGHIEQLHTLLNQLVSDKKLTEIDKQPLKRYIEDELLQVGKDRQQMGVRSL